MGSTQCELNIKPAPSLSLPKFLGAKGDLEGIVFSDCSMCNYQFRAICSVSSEVTKGRRTYRICELFHEMFLAWVEESSPGQWSVPDLHGTYTPQKEQ